MSLVKYYHLSSLHLMVTSVQEEIQFSEDRVDSARG